MWTAVWCGATANVLIQWCNAKASSLDEGEASFTAPLQAMTPGLITILAVLLGEFPSSIGIAGIVCMAAGSYVLLWKKTPKRWWEYFGPFARLKLLLTWRQATSAERSRMLVVALSLASACLGTLGLLFDGLYVRRSFSLQGIVLGSMGLTAILCSTYVVWYLMRPDRKESQNWGAALKYPFVWFAVAVGVLWVIHVLSIMPGFNQALVAYVGTLKRFSVLFTVILGYAFYKEADFKKRLWAAGLIVLGAILIASDQLPSRLADRMELIGL